MAKLQLYVSRSSRGFSNLLAVNSAEDVRCMIRDFSEALESIDYDKSSAHTFYLLTYLETGLIATVIRTLAGQRRNDHFAASVFVPADTALLPSDVDEIRSVLETILSRTETNLSPEDAATLKALFAADYPVAESRPSRLPSHGKVYAYAYFGDGAPSLRQYTDARFYLPQFARYAGVLLIDRTSGARGKHRSLNVTRDKLPATTLMRAPQPTGGFEPYIFGHPFRRDLTVAAGEPLNIEWRCPGFDNVVQTVVPKAGVVCSVEAPDMEKALKVLSRSAFYVTERGIHRLPEAQVKVNGQIIDEDRAFTLKELTEAQVEVELKGYTPFSATMNLAATSQALVSLKKLHRTYRFDMPLKMSGSSSDSVHIYLNTKRRITESPIEGYVVSGGEVVEGKHAHNSLVYVGSNSRRMKELCISAAIAALAVGFAIGWFWSRSAHKPVMAETELVITDSIAAPAVEEIK